MASVNGAIWAIRIFAISCRLTRKRGSSNQVKNKTIHIEARNLFFPGSGTLSILMSHYRYSEFAALGRPANVRSQIKTVCFGIFMRQAGGCRELRGRRHGMTDVSGY